jgi:sugar (pentulose or hexulose) kinase
VVASGRCRYPAEAVHVDGPRVEQDPCAWTSASRTALRQLVQELPSDCEIIGVAVDATSGTFLLADAEHKPLTRGIMYNDQRAVEEAPEVAERLRDCLEPYGIRMAPTFALPKIVHLARREPELFAQCRRILHQTDWIVGMLTGRYDVTDISSALKTGADPGELAWPDAIEDLGIPRDRLPAIVVPGSRIGEVSPDASNVTGLPVGTPVLAGCSDGTAGFLASGAAQIGDLNVTLGSTLVFKVVASRPIVDPTGAVYNHRHPSGGFLPGASSSAGAEWVEHFHCDDDFDELGLAAKSLLPTRHVVYPLIKTGERFPFVSAHAVGFGLDEIDDPTERFAAGMEGLAFLERLGIERLEELGLRIGPTIYATGGGAAAQTWLSIRAAVSRRTYSVPQYPECAVGAAVLAATPYFGDCEAASAGLVRSGRYVETDSELADAYEEGYQRFCAALRERGFL